ncbi:carboxylesterase family protein [Algoriphagus sp. CAU 1675]|uniref:carboxylesterase/lipase family protein n=1 Tax=Algoriphagus sp. CAU 1675 TaxID=3032597 RepID=UPI0023DAE2D2|nr:carboxylesterase family protein [Algoriphagus sp. CAU 1675]MDF2159233.1 carboxylesterase family protein [Algoriphagus sp. CAU 1675]
MKKLHLILFLGILACSKPSSENLIQVQSLEVTGGKVSGTQDSLSQVKIFKGIPFAAPPIGELRWKAPQPVLPWDGIKACVANPASAMQNPPVPFFAWSEEFLIPKEPISEDCLYLNVWTGAEKSDEKRPVMVWIHGGGFSGGSGTVPLYDGLDLAKEGIVVVTINYRLGIFGFFAHPELSQESDNAVSGNYGILDQIAALEWVKSNIATFGGDPENVTIAGQSAGAFSVNALVVSPQAKGLFQKAIAQSGGMFNRGGGLVSGFTGAEERGATLMKDLGIASIQDFRLLDADSLLKIPGRFGPVVDGKVIPSVRETFEQSSQSDVPLLTGWNADDNVSFGPKPTPEEFRKNAVKQYGGRAGEYLELFPAGNEVELEETQGIIGELQFGFQNYTWAKMQTEKGSYPAYLYYFTRIPPGEPNYGAFHSAEFSYALHTLRNWNRPFEQVDYDLEKAMSSYWLNFIKTGNPNGDGWPEWPVFDPQNPMVMELGDEVKSRPVRYWPQLQFMESLNQ